ncbi:hypothetical protein IJT93_02160 [bacterium]|nr:hypothetical protein [bacterium]
MKIRGKKIVSNSHKNGVNMQNVADILNEHGVVACTTDMGCLLLARCDSAEALQRLRKTAAALGGTAVFRCLPDLDQAWKLWDKSVKTQELCDFLNRLCLGMVIVSAPSAAGSGLAGRENLRKTAVWISGNKMAENIINSSYRPLAGTLISSGGTGGKDLQQRIADESDLFIVSESGCGSSSPMIIDVSSFDWRIISLGCYSCEELRSLTDHSFILSGCSCDRERLRRIFAANIWVYEGTPARICRRMRHLCEHIKKADRLAFFINSQQLYSSLKELESNLLSDEAGRLNIVYPMFADCAEAEGDSALKRAERFKELLDQYRFDENIRLIAVEADNSSEGGKAFGEYVKSLANQIIPVGVKEENSYEESSM